MGLPLLPRLVQKEGSPVMVLTIACCFALPGLLGPSRCPKMPGGDLGEGGLVHVIGLLVLIWSLIHATLSQWATDPWQHMGIGGDGCSDFKTTIIQYRNQTSSFSSAAPHEVCPPFWRSREAQSFRWHLENWQSQGRGISASCSFQATPKCFNPQVH